jgi:hypothetical protein
LILLAILEHPHDWCYRSIRKKGFFRDEFMENLDTGDGQLRRRRPATNGKIQVQWEMATYRAAAEPMK